MKGDEGSAGLTFRDARLGRHDELGGIFLTYRLWPSDGSSSLTEMYVFGDG